jgi:hypothetical protein
MTAQQGGTPQGMYITAILSGEVVSTLTVSFPNLPPGLTVWPNQPTTFGINLLPGLMLRAFIVAALT